MVSININIDNRTLLGLGFIMFVLVLIGVAYAVDPDVHGHPDADWQDIVLKNGWLCMHDRPAGNYGAPPCEYYKDANGHMHFRGVLYDGTPGTVPFELATEYLPDGGTASGTTWGETGACRYYIELKAAGPDALHPDVSCGARISLNDIANYKA